MARQAAAAGLGDGPRMRAAGYDASPMAASVFLGPFAVAPETININHYTTKNNLKKLKLMKNA